MSERTTTIPGPDATQGMGINWPTVIGAEHGSANGAVGNADFFAQVVGGMDDGRLRNDYGQHHNVGAEEPATPFDVAVTLLEELHGLEDRKNRMPADEFEQMATTFADACNAVIDGSGKADDQKAAYREELGSYISRFRSINAGDKVKTTPATKATESKIDGLFPLDAEAVAKRAARANNKPLSESERQPDVLTRAELEGGDKLTGKLSGMKDALKAVQQERGVKKASEYKAAAIEKRRNSTEINERNELVRANIFGTGDRVFLDNDGKRLEGVGKLRGMLNDNRFGDTKAERQQAVKQYQEDIKSLMEDHDLELCQAELIIDQRIGDKLRITEMLDQRMAEGRSTKGAAERAQTEYEKEDAERLRLVKEGGVFTEQEYFAVKAGKELYQLPTGGETGPRVSGQELLVNLASAVEAHKNAVTANDNEARKAAEVLVADMLNQVIAHQGDKLSADQVKNFRESIVKKMGLAKDGSGAVAILDAKAAAPKDSAERAAKLAELAAQFKDAVGKNDVASQEKIHEEVRELLKTEHTNDKGFVNDAKCYKADLEWAEQAGIHLTPEEFEVQGTALRLAALKAKKENNRGEYNKLVQRERMLFKQLAENQGWDGAELEEKNAHNEKFINNRQSLKERIAARFTDKSEPQADSATKRPRKEVLRNRGLLAVGIVAVGAWFAIAHGNDAAPKVATTTSSTTALPGAGTN